SGCGSHAVAALLAGSTQARLRRGCAPTLSNAPPTYTWLPSARSAWTAPVAPGFHSVGRPVSASSAPRLRRGTPPAMEQAPPTHTVSTPKFAVDSVIAFTLPSTVPSQFAGLPLKPSKASRPLIVLPEKNSPPTNTVSVMGTWLVA